MYQSYCNFNIANLVGSNKFADRNEILRYLFIYISGFDKLHEMNNNF